MPNDEVDKQPDSLRKIDEEKTVNADFTRARDNQEPEQIEPQFGSEQVENTELVPELTPEGSVPRETHLGSMAQDDTRAKEQQEKAAFIARQAKQREQNRGKSKDIDRGRE